MNRYAYVRNNPVNLVDPSGNFFFIFAVIAAIAQAAVAVASAIVTIAGSIASAVGTLLGSAAGFSAGGGFSALQFASFSFSAYQAIQSGNPWGMAGGLLGGAAFGAIGQKVGLGMASAMGGAAYTFAGGAIAGAAEFAIGGFGAGFGAALAGGASLRDAVRTGAHGAAVGGITGAAIQGSYMAGWQNTLHGMSAGQVAQAQGYDPSIGSALGADAGLRGRFGKTDVYRHYSYADEAGNFAGGLRPDSWATKDVYASGRLAQQKLSIPPHRLGDAPPNAVYNVFVDRTRTPVLDVASIPAKHFKPSIYAPQGAFRTGTGSGGYFPLGTPPGSVIYGGPVDP